MLSIRCGPLQSDVVITIEQLSVYVITVKRRTVCWWDLIYRLSLITHCHLVDSLHLMNSVSKSTDVTPSTAPSVYYYSTTITVTMSCRAYSQHYHFRYKTLCHAGNNTFYRWMISITLRPFFYSTSYVSCRPKCLKVNSYSCFCFCCCCCYYYQPTNVCTIYYSILTGQFSRFT